MHVGVDFGTAFDRFWAPKKGYVGTKIGPKIDVNFATPFFSKKLKKQTKNQ